MQAVKILLRTDFNSFIKRFFFRACMLVFFFQAQEQARLQPSLPGHPKKARVPCSFFLRVAFSL